MAGVDNSVVSMKFDNAAFEQKVASTIQSLDKLRNSLDFTNSTKGMQDLGAATKSFNMEGMASSVDGISAKFIGLATVGITALANITNRAVDAGIQLAKSLTLDPITQGFGEFELKMGSIQTIMAGSGASLEVVNEKLQLLNEYSDRTIYSFKDMTSNIGKFTNAGVSLDESVGAIQGVANVAALAGANSEEASRAMYNFAQALSTGSVKLIDWKSIELANMGTVEFKQQIIDTAVAMGTLNKASDGTLTTLKGTEVTTKNFNSTLSEAWFTSEVLTSTLGKFSDTTTDIGQRASKAATEIKTFSQMLSTMKESVGSGWATTFENIFGNFTEGVTLWTGINEAFGKVVGSSADARNQMLKTWHDFGSRTEFFQSLADIMKYLGDIIKPIKDAFREIFPKKTGEDLIRLTYRFGEFTDKLKIGGDTSKAIKTAFSAFFSILDIGWEIFKGVTKVVFALVGAAWSLISPILKLAAGTGGIVTGFHDMLVGGGGISAFFDGITTAIDVGADAIKSFAGAVINILLKFAPLFSGAYNAIKNFAGGVVEFFSGLGPVLLAPYEALKKLTAAIGDFFESLSFGKDKKDGITETSEELDKSASLATKLLDALKNVFSQIGEVMSGIVSGITGAFKGLGGAIADALGSGNFDQVLDVLKVGLGAGIFIYIRKFFREGLKLDFGQGALIDKLKNMLGTLESSLKSLQANIRADTLLKIATAMGILAISIVALSLVDAAALAKSMVAITAGFTQLTAVMLVLEKSSAGGGSIKIVAMASGMVLLAAAMALLVIPIMILSRMGWEELAKGLVGVSVGMLVMATAMQIVGNAKNLAGVVRAGISMILIAAALIVLAFAIKKFSEMNLVSMGIGLAQAALGIGLLILALKGMPDDIAAKGLGLLILALALRSLAKVVQLFAGISFGVLAKGFISIAIGLQMIALAMRTFPEDMPSKAAGLVLMSGALWIMAVAVEKMGSIPFGDLIKGIGALSIMLGVLAIAVMVMSGTQGGVIGLIAAAGGLLIIGHAIEKVGSIPFGDLIKGILGLAAVLAVLAIASAAAPALLLLGVALVAIGAGLALVGAGVALAGKGLELMAKFGGAAMGVLVETLKETIRQLPQFISAFVDGFVSAFIEIAGQAPKIVDAIAKMLSALLDAVIKVVPKIVETLGTIISGFFGLIQEKVPEFVETGLTILMAFLTGIRNNIREIVYLVSDIITEFLDAMAEKVPEVIESLLNFFLEIITGLAFALGENATAFIPVGQALIDGFITGLTTNLGNLLQFFIELPGKILGIIKEALGISSPSTVFSALGGDLIIGLFNGLVETIPKVMTWFIELPGKILGWIGNVLTKLVPKGIDFIAGLLKGIIDGAVAVMEWYVSLPFKVLGWIGDVVTKLVPIGINFLAGLLTGVISGAVALWEWFTALPGQIIGWIGDAGSMLLNVGMDIVRGLWGGINAMKDWVMEKVKGFAGSVVDSITGFLGIGSPSKVMCDIGIKAALGFANGLVEDDDVEKNASALANSVISSFQDTLRKIPDTLIGMDEFNPTITPVLDLSKVQTAAKDLDNLMNVTPITAAVSYERARTIATTAETTGTDTAESPTGPTEITFEQNIYAPTALSTSDIYRNTKSQIALAKEELEIA